MDRKLLEGFTNEHTCNLDYLLTPKPWWVEGKHHNFTHDDCKYPFVMIMTLPALLLYGFPCKMFILCHTICLFFCHAGKNSYN